MDRACGSCPAYFTDKPDHAGLALAGDMPRGDAFCQFRKLPETDWVAHVGGVNCRLSWREASLVYGSHDADKVPRRSRGAF